MSGHGEWGLPGAPPEWLEALGDQMDTWWGSHTFEYLTTPPNRVVPPHPYGADYEVGERYWHDGAWWVIVSAVYDGGWHFGARRAPGLQFEPDEWDRLADAAHQSRSQYVEALYAKAIRDSAGPQLVREPALARLPREPWWCTDAFFLALAALVIAAALLVYVVVR